MENLHGQLDNVQRDMSIKEVELKHLTLQLELLTNQHAAHVNELEEQITALMESAVLKGEKEEESEVEASEEETLSSALLQEKNQELDHLNNEIQRLEQELEATRDNKVKMHTDRKLSDGVVVATVQGLGICLINVFHLFFERFWRLSLRICAHRWSTLSLKS